MRFMTSADAQQFGFGALDAHEIDFLLRYRHVRLLASIDADESTRCMMAGWMIEAFPDLGVS